MASPPILHVIAGPNGAGKSTFYEAILRDLTDAEFVNADLLAAEALGAFAATEEDAKLGQKLADDRRATLMADHRSLVTESTFSHGSKVELVREALTLGYEVVVYHVSVDSADLAVARVAERHDNGGHPVPEERIRGRFDRNRSYIREAVLLAQGAFVFDNSLLGQPPRRLVTFAAGRIIAVATELPDWVIEVYADDLADLAPST